MLTLVVEDDGNVSINSKDRVAALAIALQALKQVGASIHKAYVPHSVAPKDITKMTLAEKLKYYDKRRNV